MTKIWHHLLLAFFISESEYEYFLKYETEKFEKLLEENHEDPFHVSREPIN